MKESELARANADFDRRMAELQQAANSGDIQRLRWCSERCGDRWTVADERHRGSTPRREELARVLKKHSGIRRIVEDLYPDSATSSTSCCRTPRTLAPPRRASRFRKTALCLRAQWAPVRPPRHRGNNRHRRRNKDGGRRQDRPLRRRLQGRVRLLRNTAHLVADVFVQDHRPGPARSARARQSWALRTRFEFPFNNPKKTARLRTPRSRPVSANSPRRPCSFSRTWSRFAGRSKTSRSARSSNCTSGTSLRGAQADGGETTISSHFLRFDKPVEGLEKQRVAVAFALDFLPNVSHARPAEPLASS